MGEFLLIGGEPFYLNPSSTLYRQVVEKLKGKKHLLILGTAFGDDQAVINRIANSEFAKLFETTHLSLFNTHQGWRNDLVESDVILVPGGATRSMLAVWNEWKVPGMIYNAVKNGTTVIGISAGAICWFDQYVTDSDADGLTLETGLGFLRGAAIAHAETITSKNKDEIERLGVDILSNEVVKLGESELKIMRLQG